MKAYEGLLNIFEGASRGSLLDNLFRKPIALKHVFILLSQYLVTRQPKQLSKTNLRRTLHIFANALDVSLIKLLNT